MLSTFLLAPGAHGRYSTTAALVHAPQHPPEAPGAQLRSPVSWQTSACDCWQVGITGGHTLVGHCGHRALRNGSKLLIDFRGTPVARTLSLARTSPHTLRGTAPRGRGPPPLSCAPSQKAITWSPSTMASTQRCWRASQTRWRGRPAGSSRELSGSGEP